jgi:hypothetical protein
MRIANCKTVYREIEESEVDHQLSEMAAQHVLSCTMCQEFYESRIRLRNMLAALGTVEAPSDFDFRVRARLANEKGKSHAAFSIRRREFGFPSLILATLTLLVGGIFAARSLWSPIISSPIAQSEPSGKEPVGSVGQNAAMGNEEVGQSSNQTNPAGPSSEAKPQTLTTKRAGRTSVASLRNSGPVASKDFSSAQAPIVKRQELLKRTETAAIFPIEASEPLRVSLDYATGISRTISLPALSFGSQQVVNRGVSPMVKASAKGVW